MKLLYDTINYYQNAFQKLLCYISCLKKLNSKNHFYLQLIDKNCFEQILVAPTASQFCLSVCYYINSLNSIFLNKKFILMLLLAVEINVNKQTMIFAGAIIQSENFNFWQCLFTYLQHAMPAIF